LSDESSVRPMSSAEQLGKFSLGREGLLRFTKQNSKTIVKSTLKDSFNVFFLE